MTTFSPPADGDTGWGDVLNAYLTSTLQDGLSAQATNLSDHEANSPADPHGDRAFALNLMLPITQNVNKPGGFLQLDSTTGMVPSRFLPQEDTWHDLRPYGNAFATPYGYLPPQYRQMNGGVQVTGYIQITSRLYWGFPLFANALPSGVWPVTEIDLPVAVYQQPPCVLTISTQGVITLSQLPTRLPDGAYVSLSCWYPLNSYGLITS